MKVSRIRIAKVIADRTLRDGISGKLSSEIAAYLLSERRVGQLDSVLRDIQTAWAEAGYIEVSAASRYPLASKVQADIKAQVRALYPNAKQVVITEIRDPEVIGGARLSLADQQLDLSVEAKLNKFKRLTHAGKD